MLVAAGLTAPFVPIYSRLRHDDGDDRSANDFGRTVLTGAVGRDGGRERRRSSSPRRGWPAVVGEGFDAGDPGRCTSSWSGSTASRRSCSRPRSRSARSSSPTAGSSSTPSRRSSTRPGSSSARSSSPATYGIFASAWGAVAGRRRPPRRSGRSARRGRRSGSGPAFAVADGGVPRVPAPDGPADGLGRRSSR